MCKKEYILCQILVCNSYALFLVAHMISLQVDLRHLNSALRWVQFETKYDWSLHSSENSHTCKKSQIRKSPCGHGISSISNVFSLIPNLTSQLNVWMSPNVLAFRSFFNFNFVNSRPASEPFEGKMRHTNHQVKVFQSVTFFTYCLLVMGNFCDAHVVVTFYITISEKRSKVSFFIAIWTIRIN